MLDIFRELRGLLRVSHVHIDSWVFRLHYSVTTTCMFAFSLIVSAKQYVGNPIDCIHSKDIPEEVLNTYCWIHSTYTIPSAFWKRIGFDVAHPGVDKTIDPEERRYHKYYQWVCFCLFFQVRKFAFFFRYQISLLRWFVRDLCLACLCTNHFQKQAAISKMCVITFAFFLLAIQQHIERQCYMYMFVHSTHKS